MIGLIEQTFSFDWSAERVRFWPTGTFRYPGGSKITLEGTQDAEDRAALYRSIYPDWTIDVFDVADGEGPIIVSWEEWRRATDKFNRRNPAFQMRG